MVVIKKKVSQKKSADKLLIQNFVALQKVMVNLSIKFDGLSSQISKLLNLFEISAKALAEKGVEMPENKKIIEKLDNISEQNKVVARGLTLMHQAYIQSSHQAPQPRQGPPPQNKQNIPQQQNPNIPPEKPSMQGYQRSISSRR